jgi:hypothetical protein
VDALITSLEAKPPFPNPLGSDGEPTSRLLFGSWKLIYASNGTVVTRTALAQALVAASSLPGVGLRDIQQNLLSTAGELLPASVGALLAFYAPVSNHSLSLHAPTCQTLPCRGHRDRQLGCLWPVCAGRMESHDTWELGGEERHPGAGGI